MDIDAMPSLTGFLEDRLAEDEMVAEEGSRLAHECQVRRAVMELCLNAKPGHARLLGHKIVEVLAWSYRDHPDFPSGEGEGWRL